MSGLAGILAGHHAPGVHRWHATFEPAEVRHTVEHASWRLAYVDGWVASGKADVLAALGVALELPDHYGHNLDAFWDCLTDLTDPWVLLWDGWSTLARGEERTFATLVEMLRERSAELPAFTTLLRGEGPDLPDVPSLD